MTIILWIKVILIPTNENHVDTNKIKVSKLLLEVTFSLTNQT